MRNLKKGGTYLQQKRIRRYGFIEKQKGCYPVQVLCRVMKSSEAAYYAWRTGRTYKSGEKRNALAASVKEVFYLHRRRYGARRISADLIFATAKRKVLLFGDFSG